MFCKLIRFDVINTKQISFIMKKIIALFVIMVGFSFTANAQQKKAAVKTTAATTANVDAKQQKIQADAKADLNALNAVVKLSDADKQSIQGLFEYKYRLHGEGLSQERKDVLSQTIDAKIRATLSADQVAKLDANPKLLKQLTH